MTRFSRIRSTRSAQMLKQKHGSAGRLQRSRGKVSPARNPREILFNSFTFRVKADALFSYQPPLNLIAFVIMFPASYILSPRWFHKVYTPSLLEMECPSLISQVNVAMIRITAFPILVTIAFYERQTIDVPGATFYDRVTGVAERVFDTLPRRLKRLSTRESEFPPCSD